MKANIPQIIVSIERSSAQVAALIESLEQLGPKHIESNLFSIQSRLCDAEVLLAELNGGGKDNSEVAENIEVCDSVSAVGVLLEQICVSGAHYVRGRFDDTDGEDENFVMLNLIMNLANKARKQIRHAERELFKDL